MARGSIIKRSSGAYAIRYWDLTGRRHYETIGSSRRDAARALASRLYAATTRPRQKQRRTRRPLRPYPPFPLNPPRIPTLP